MAVISGKSWFKTLVGRPRHPDFNTIVIFLFQTSVKLLQLCNYLFSYTYNCRLPRTFWVTTEQGYLLQTTHCIFTSRASREILTIILFAIYIVMATAEVFWTIHNIHAWRNCFRLVRFLPFENIQDFTAGRNQITDLHLIMALVKVNEGSRDVSYNKSKLN